MKACVKRGTGIFTAIIFVVLTLFLVTCFGPRSLKKTIAAGGDHTCYLTEAGGVKCWGRNDYGQLGNNSTVQKSYAPVDVVGLESGVQAIAAGRYHTCAITGSGSVKCWGGNSMGQLGDGTYTNRNAPVDVSSLTDTIVAIAPGAYRTCVLTSGGSVKCWGWNAYGGLGNGSKTGSLTPVDVVGLAEPVAAISGTSHHTCALTVSGSVKCWGRNNDGQLGDGTLTDSAFPVDVSGLESGVHAIAAGGWYSFAITDSGALKAWGGNFSGQLGDGTEINRLTPVDVTGLNTGVYDVSVGDPYHACALVIKRNGRILTSGVKCWGGNYFGKLGDGTTTDSLVPVDVVGLPNNVIEIDSGASHNCARSYTGDMKCWGWNAYGQLGTVTPGYWSLVPVDVVGLE